MTETPDTSRGPARRHHAPTSRNIVFLLSGSRGDIQPAACLALELRERGHHIAVLCTPNMVDFVRSMGIPDARPAGVNISEMTDRARRILGEGHPVKVLRFGLSFLRHATVDLDRDITDAMFPGGRPLDDPAAGPVGAPDLIVANPMCQRQGLNVSERLGVPLVVLRYAPVSENSTIGWIDPLTRHLPGPARRWSWVVRAWVDFLFNGVWEHRFRRSVGLPRTLRTVPRRLADRRVPQLQLCDPVVVPEIAREWEGTDRIFTGYLDVPPSVRAAMGEAMPDDADLAAWLAAGDPPLFVTFGSMPVPDPDLVRRQVLDACRGRGVRVLFSLGGGAGRGAGDDADVFEVGAVDQSALLPRCAAAVHHGGAGTTAASLRAGVPTMIYAFGFEQPFWAARVAELGVGTGGSFSGLDAATFRADLDRALAPETVRRAAEVARAMVSPADAVRRSADIVEAQLTL
ncbi:glycosyltransferase [Corynebacterium bovis]|uniref:glycosyltransferase n=1 Tax=Corynebacterium bovis TaxID=36808 RepID=UPI000F652C95|nr:glycosyltransferase [Corynebacterium bovis]RRO79787.1 glycosyl transferase [Corynebacterium bovis]RRO80529.1 glycosyl transferase [Corynebacterium bovis]RRO81222.1 glycosyl transferase [Corynebacterium bovis]RRO91478.1 glycosyl transferase [Corynebacterium bovis]RRO92945.1 glycosyl transferase [Corynebacterium bovis]